MRSGLLDVAVVRVSARDGLLIGGCGGTSRPGGRSLLGHCDLVLELVKLRSDLLVVNEVLVMVSAKLPEVVHH